MKDDPQDETIELGGDTPDSDRSELPTVAFSPGSQASLGGTARLPRLAEGQQFGRYRVLRELGRGGMGEVYEAEDVESGRLVALKLLPMIGVESLKKRFVREGRLAAQVSHPNSVYVFEADEIEDVPIIAMEVIRGGTLAEKVARDGAMPVPQAVDTMLQVIAGLKEAEGRGILHRDVKPSNCFLEQDGTVKVGDYGLSMSTSVGAEATRLTTDGSQLGTPAYASPEQMRGRETDVRSDIYSVGATLYFLLTNRAPFEADNAVELIAKVIGDPVTSPRQLRPEIPKGLERIVLRCLAREPERRFADYAQLAKAMEPFRSRQETAANLGIRFAAGFLDNIVLTAFAMVHGGLLALGGNAPEWSSSPRGEVLVSLAISLLYYGLLEGLWGASLGKRFFGLRVAGVDGSSAGPARAIVRVLVYSIGAYLVLMTSSRTLAMFLGWSFVLLWVTARKSNGYAAIHDLVSRTRVVHRPKAAERVRLQVSADRTSSAPGTTIEPAVVGPFDVVGELTVAGSERLLRGHDPRLRRGVWLHMAAKDSPPVEGARRNLARAGRLRWLGGRRDGEEAWDAYEAPSGAAFREATTAPQRWPTLRDWLFDIAQEIVLGTREGAAIDRLTTNHVWVGTDGRARLLDWPLEASASARTDETYAVAEPEQQRLFLLRLAHEALAGQPLPDEDLQARSIEVPLPLHARRILEELSSGVIPDAATLIARLDETADLPRQVERSRRFTQLGIQAALPGFIAITFALGTLFAVAGKDDLSIGKALAALGMLSNIWTMVVGPFALVAVVTAFAFRGGATLRILQIAAVDRTGRETGRPRAALRGLLAWGIVILVACVWIATLAPAVSVAVDEAGPAEDGVENASEWGEQVAELVVNNVKNKLGRFQGAALLASGPVALLLFLGGLGYALRNPSRGIQDRIAGTELVPR